jgi:predicted nucleic acid-binding Zn ribbon protein
MRRRKAQSFSEAFGEFLHHEKLDETWAGGLLWAKWHLIVGGEIAKSTQKIRLRGSVLSVWITSASGRHQLMLNEPTIKAQCNELLGRPVIETLIASQG